MLRWISLFLAVVAAAAWCAWLAGDVREPAPDVARPVAGSDPAEERGPAPHSPSGRVEAELAGAPEPAAGSAEELPVEHPEPTPTPRSPQALDLEAVAASFLTLQPRVSELLDLAGSLAEQAVVEPGSLTLQRGQGGELLSARGTLAMGDLRGTFRVDADGYAVAWSAEPADGQWARCDLLLAFQADDSGVRGCHATVQFQPREPRPGPEGELLAGWSVGTDADGGTRAVPLVLHAAEGAWELGDSETVLAQEFPWLSATGGFEAWLRLLQPFLEAPR